MSSYTPGPWSVGATRHYEHSGGAEVAIHYGPAESRGNCIAHAYGHGPSGDAEADARLMAAAPEQSMIAALRREAERIEEDATFSGKSHFNAEDTWLHRNYWLGGTATALGAVAGATLIESQPEWAAALTLLASLLTGLLTVLKPSERAALHHSAGEQYLALRNDARLFREVELLQTDRPDELVERLKALAARRDELNQDGNVPINQE